MVSKYIINKLLRTLENIEHGTLTLITPANKRYTFGNSCKPKATLCIKSSHAIVNILAKGDIGFAQSYRDGLLDVDDLIALFTLTFKNSHILNKYIYGSSLLSFVPQILYYFRSNTIRGSKKNIHAHYDIGNDFYSLWLDPTMTYSGGIFKDKSESLMQAQHNKYDRIIQRCKDAKRLLEIGCGWGGFANRILQDQDINIKGITISKQQYTFARDLLKQRAAIALEDYRSQSGQYDAIVSIEMFEAVGEKFWSIYFKKISSLLNSRGKAVIQTITIDNKIFERYKRAGDAIRTFIFPGGMLPSEKRFKEEVQRANLKVVDTFYFKEHYATTLRHWLNSFEANKSKIRDMGFDEKFIRIWRAYLCLCIVGFCVGNTNVMQAELVHA